MSRSGLLYIMIALVLSAVFTTLIYQTQKNKSIAMTRTKAITAKLLIVNKNLNRGSTLKLEDLEWKTWPNLNIPSNAILAETRKKEDLVGSILKEPVNQGQMLLDSMVIASDNLSPLAKLLQPGMRAFTVDIKTAYAIGGLLKPGDSVDVILTYNIGKNSVNKDVISKTILEAISVIAVDQDYTPDLSKSSGGSKGASKGVMSQTKNVTLEVTPKEAEILAHDQSKGVLSLSLTSPVNTLNSISVRDKRVASNELDNDEHQHAAQEVYLYRGDKMDSIEDNQ